tara:strand:+ start:30245 stop:31999 length:1755 start_codon:yes stop_codon:yes gene_type:complete
MPNAIWRLNAVEDKDSGRRVAIDDIIDGSSVVTSTGEKTLVEALDSRVIYVETVDDLKALPISGIVENQAARVTTTGRAGPFAWKSGDMSASVGTDPNEGVCVAPEEDSTGASGAWFRRVEGAVNVKWFGAEGRNNSAVDDYGPIQAAINYVCATGAPNGYANVVGGSVFIPAGTYWTNDTIEIPPECGITLKGEGWGNTVIRLNVDGKNVLNAYGKTPGTSIEGILFASSKTGVSGINIAGNGISVRNCWMSTQRGIQIGVDGLATDIIIADCGFDQCLDYAFYITGDGYPRTIAWQGSHTILITNCWTFTGLAGTLTLGGYGTYIKGVDGVTISSMPHQYHGYNAVRIEDALDIELIGLNLIGSNDERQDASYNALRVYGGTVGTSVIVNGGAIRKSPRAGLDVYTGARVTCLGTVFEGNATNTTAADEWRCDVRARDCNLTLSCCRFVSGDNHYANIMFTGSDDTVNSVLNVNSCSFDNAPRKVIRAYNVGSGSPKVAHFDNNIITNANRLGDASTIIVDLGAHRSAARVSNNTIECDINPTYWCASSGSNCYTGIVYSNFAPGGIYLQSPSSHIYDNISY